MEPQIGVTTSLRSLSLSMSPLPNVSVETGTMCSSSVLRAKGLDTSHTVPEPQKAQTFGLNIGGTTIPCFDTGEIEKLTGEARKAKVFELCEALKVYGFIGIKADKLIDILPKVEAEMIRYFDQEAKVKEKDIHGNDGQTGFSPIGTEKAAGAKRADKKETYFIPPVETYTKWPEGQPSFKESMEPYYKVMREYVGQVMYYLAEYLEIDKEHIDKSKMAPGNLLRLAYYPAKQVGDPDDEEWAGEHTDLNFITGLPKSKVPGLEMNRNGVHIPASVPDGYIVINTGELLEKLTAGKFRAVPHRVRNQGGEYEFVRRYATPFFGTFYDEFSVAPLQSCVDEMTRGMSPEEKGNYLKNYPDVTAGQNLFSRLLEMNSVKNMPPEAAIKGLLEAGLLRQPSDKLKAHYPNLFPAAISK